jgi:hypothetical protein
MDDTEMIAHTNLQITYDILGGLTSPQDSPMASAMAKAMLPVPPHHGRPRP